MGTPTAPGTTGPAPQSWTPPTDVERALYAAKARGDGDGYLRVLLGADTLGYKAKEQVDRRRLTAGWLPYTGADGRAYFAVFTRGELLPRRPDAVACAVELPLPAEEWWADGLAGLVVNPGTPTERVFPDARRQRRRWKALRKEVPRPGHDDDALLAKYTGPLHGPLAHGLACGAHLAVHRRDLWNDVGDVTADYATDAFVLKDSWGTTDRATWTAQLNHLLEGRNSPPEPEFALRARRETAAHHPGAQLDAGFWQQVITASLRAHGAGEELIGAVVEVSRRITRYEARLRADGVLPPDGFVTSALAYDYGRAVNYARWGVGARLGEPREAERVALRAGELSRVAYASWHDFSAGYVLGRVLRFDDESFGHMYGSAISPHRILTTDPASPWRNIPFGAAGG